jgi:hypothetical protein
MPTLLGCVLALWCGHAAAAEMPDNQPRRAARSAAEAIEHAAVKTGEAVETAARKTGQGLEKAADKTGQALQKAGRKVEGLFDADANQP